MPHLIILDDATELSDCLWESAKLAEDAHPEVENNPTGQVAQAYNDLTDAIATAKSNVCAARSALAEKLS